MRLKNFTLSLLLMAAPAVASATDYYVSPAGSGSKDGSSADNAWGVAELQARCTTGNSNFQNGDKVYLAAGTYAPTATLYFNKGVELIGAEGEARTIFSGDTDNDGVADRDRLININTAIGDDLVVETPNTKPVNIKNIDFTLLKLAQPNDVNASGAAPVGALYIQNCGSTVTVEKCNFYNIVNTGQGGSAICSKFSRIVVKDCTFKNIKALARGIVIRLHSNTSSKGYTTINNCIFENNEATTTTETDPCGVVMLQYGQELNVSNCVFKNNTAGGRAACIFNGTEPDNTYKRVCEVENCYFLNNTSADNNVILENSATTTTNNYIGADTEFPSINVTNVGAATYYLGASFTMPKGLTGKTFASVQDKMLVANKVYNGGDVVPAGTALLIEGVEGTYNPVLAETTEEAPEGNLLKGADVTAQTTGGESYYKLEVGDSGLGFYWANPEGAAFESAAHKAYLCLNTASACKAFFFNGETTGIEGVNDSNASLRSNGVKVLKDGRLVIEKGGKMFTVAGQQI